MKRPRIFFDKTIEEMTEQGYMPVIGAIILLTGEKLNPEKRLPRQLKTLIEVTYRFMYPEQMSHLERIDAYTLSSGLECVVRREVRTCSDNPKVYSSILYEIGPVEKNKTASSPDWYPHAVLAYVRR